MERIAGCRFYPWVGDAYEAGLRGARVLILGESLYLTDPSHGYADTTRDTIGRQAAGAERDRFYTRVMGLVEGGPTWRADRRAFWHSVAFYNYVQEPVGNAARQRPTEAMWAAAHAPYRQVVAALRPDCVVALGQELWGRLAAAGGPGVAHAVGVRHPSAPGFGYAKWRPPVAAAIARAGGGAGPARGT